MTNVNAIYGQYTEKVNAQYDKEATLNESLKSLIGNTVDDIKLLYSKYNFLTPIDIFISSIKEDALKNKESKFIKNNSSKIKSFLTKDLSHVKCDMLEFKGKLLYNLHVRLYHSTDRLTKYKSMKMPYYSFNYLNAAVNSEMAKSILRGYSFNFGLESVNMGKIVVQEIERKFDKDGLPADKSINWDESNKYKQILIDNGEVPYNKNTAPNGKKWFLYHTEPYVYYINWCISVYSHKNIKFFKFEPTTFINTKNRCSADILDNYNLDVEDVINNPKLGFSTKLNMILKKDSTYAQTYK